GGKGGWCDCRWWGEKSAGCSAWSGSSTSSLDAGARSRPIVAANGCCHGAGAGGCTRPNRRARPVPPERGAPGERGCSRATRGIVGQSVTARRTLDLRGIACPLSWAKARVTLETLARGDQVDLLVDDPRAARHIPRAAEATGHHVTDVTAEGGSWRITIEV